MELDRDLASIQEARDLVRKAQAAQAVLAEMNQQQVDRIVAAMARAAEGAAQKLAQMAVSDTGFGKECDKITKNLFAARTVYNYIKDAKTIGVIREDTEKKMLEVAIPVGVVAGLVPSTNPTSTTIFKALISVKAGNALIVSPHPSALNCIGEAVRILNAAAVEAGAPDGLVTMMTIPTLGGTAELMKRSNMIIATGGSAMVKAAYSSGTPALGVGPGNVPAYIERTADIPNAVRRIIASKTFDNGTICASEQSVVTKRPGADTVNPRIVGKSALEIAKMAGIQIPQDTKVILCEQDKVGKDYPFSIEKLSPLLAFYTEPDWQHACEKCLELLRFGGIGHSLSIHTNNPELVRTFVLKKPVSRLLVNTGSTQGGIGATTGISPSFTLGCGAVGGSATSDNVTVHHLYQIRRAAYGLIEPEDVSRASGGGSCSGCAQPSAADMSADDMERIVQAVVKQLRGLN